MSLARIVSCVMLMIAAAGARAASPVSVAALPLDEIGGRGADLWFQEYEAESGVTNGVRIGPDRRFTTIAAEASGRTAVRLDRPDHFVEFTLARPANAIVVRAAVPDSGDGKGIGATLQLSVSGRTIGTLPVTSRYSWFYGRYPFTNVPAHGDPHHVFDESRMLLGETLSAGTIVRLAVGEGAPWIAVDLVDFELVAPPAVRPQASLSVASFGADPTGRKSAMAAFRAAIVAARRRNLPLWIPPGTFRVDGHLMVDRVTIMGAGPWHSVVRGDGVGFYGKKAPRGSRKVVLKDFAVIGEVKERDDHKQLAAIGGAMSDSLIENLWIQHVKVGLWFDGPMSNIVIRRVRIADVTADGLNFHRGVSHAVVEQSFIRGTGDDGLAAWSGKIADHDIVFRRNTVVAPVLANGIAIYGGRDIGIQDNLVADTLTQGGGIHVGNRFDAVPAAGSIDISGNLIVRSGSFDPNWKFGVGALWFYALDAPMTASIRVRDNEIVDSTEEAILFIGKPISGVVIDGLTLRNGREHRITLRSPGSAELGGLRTEGTGSPHTLICSNGFDLIGDWPHRELSTERRGCEPQPVTTIRP